MLVLLEDALVRKNEAIMLEIELDVQCTLSVSISCKRRCTFLSVLRYMAHNAIMDHMTKTKIINLEISIKNGLPGRTALPLITRVTDSMPPIG